MTEPVRVTMPRLGESVAEGTITKWLVRPGVVVAALDVIAEVDTDKVSAEIPAPVSGTIRALLVTEGQSIKVGAEIALIDAEAPASGRSQEDGEPASGGDTSSPQGAPSRAGNVAANPLPDRHRYSPSVRELARANGIDLSLLAGSGAGGRVTRRDVLRLLDEQAGRPPPSNTTVPPAPQVFEGDEVVPLTRIRRLIAENMALSKSTIPHAWQAQEVDMSRVIAHRNANRVRFEQHEGFSLTFLPYVVAGVAAALRQHSYVNATFDRDRIVLHKTINVGIAVGLEEGVVVPVIRHADALSIAGCARTINDLSLRARAKKLTADDLTGATFTVNNSGTFGTVVSYSVISPGQAGILTMGAIKDRVVAVDGRIAIRPMMFLSFSLDHRILDGLGAARFLSSCRESLEAVTKDTSLY